MKCRAYGVQKGDLFIWNGDEYSCTGKQGNHIEASLDNKRVLIAPNQLVDLVGSVLPSRDESIKGALDL